MNNKRTIILFTFLLLAVQEIVAQSTKSGTLVRKSFVSASIKGNPGGEDPVRNVTIYLPPGYGQNPAKRYPVIYFLHGFLLNDSLMMAFGGLKAVMDSAIEKGELSPMILVLPNSETLYGGSFYTNSSLTGNWADFIGKDAVSFIDANYRTIKSRNSRGLAGHSMGGYGALKMAMLFPDVFGAVYAMSPATIGWGTDFNVHDTIFRDVNKFRNQYSSFEILGDLMRGAPGSNQKFFTKLLADLARTYSPSPGTNYFSAALPVEFLHDSAIVSPQIADQWERNFPLTMVRTHQKELQSLIAFKIDWGRDDESKFIPETCRKLTMQLDSLRIQYVAEEYNGKHIDKLSGMNGRFYTDMIPFFKKYLQH